MRKPRDLVDRYFQQHYKRGAILRFYMKGDDPNRPFRHKFGIVLNKDISEEETLLAITTSKTAVFAHGRWEDDILRVPAGSYACFDLETIISLREVRPESLAELKNLCAEGQLTFEGDLTPDDLALIEQKIIASKLIERRHKKRIL